MTIINGLKKHNNRVSHDLQYLPLLYLTVPTVPNAKNNKHIPAPKLNP